MLEVDIVVTGKLEKIKSKMYLMIYFTAIITLIYEEVKWTR